MSKAIAFILHKGRVLIGRGGKWLMDVTPQDKQAELAERQRSTAATATEATADILKKLPPGTMMKPVVQRKGYFSTKFLLTSNPNPPGFLKGDIESGETAKDAIAREVEEETFTKLPANRFVEVQPYIFRVDLSDTEAKDILRNWDIHRKNGIGELVTLEWVPIADVYKMDLNRDSASALQYLPKTGGRRTRRRRGHKKPKTTKRKAFIERTK